LVTLKVFAELTPNFRLPKTMLLLELVRSTMPVPLSETLCDPVPPLSLSVSVALCAPTALGVNATPSVHEVLGATVTGIAPHVPALVTAYSAGSDEVTFKMDSGLNWPVLLTVNVFVTVWPTATLPKAAEAVTDIVV